MDFSVIGEITDIEIIAVYRSIRELPSLQRRFGRGRWRTLKELATVRLFDGSIRRAEVHWYEAHGIERRRMKIKRYVD